MMVGADKFDISAYIGDGGDHPGLAVFDTVCNYTMHGKTWREEMQKALADAGQPLGIVTDDVNVSCQVDFSEWFVWLQR